MSKIRVVLDGKNRSLSQNRLGELRKEAQSSGSEMPALLIDWVVHLLGHPNAVGTRLQPNTLQSYVSVIGQRLVEALAEVGSEVEGISSGPDAEIDWKNPEQLSQLYALVLDDADSPNHRKHMVRALREFHAYVRLKKIRSAEVGDTSVRLPDNDRYDFEAIARQAAEVDANVILYDEYLVIRRAIQQERYRWQKHPDYRVIAECLVILGYRCGLRRSEALYLRLGDFLMGGESRSEILEIWVQPYPGRTLKTPNARRRLPVQALMTDEEREVLASWYHKKLDDLLKAQANWHQARLFSPRGQTECSIQDDSKARYLYSGIRAIMNEVTGDDSLRYHHLRHSVGTWLFTALQWVGREHKAPQVEKMLGEWVNTAHRVNDQLLCGRGGQRKHLYFVSMLLGHSTPAISLEHYLHFQDLLLHALLSRQAFRSSDASDRQNNEKDLFADGQLLHVLGYGSADYLRQEIKHQGSANIYLSNRLVREGESVLTHEARPLPEISRQRESALELRSMLDEVMDSLRHEENMLGGVDSPLTPERIQNSQNRLQLLANVSGHNNVKQTRHPIAQVLLERPAGKPLPALRKRAEKETYEMLALRLQNYLHSDGCSWVLIEQALEVFRNESRQNSSTMTLTSPTDARTYLEFHKSVFGFTKSNVESTLTIEKTLDGAEFKAQRTLWLDTLGDVYPPTRRVLRKTKQGTSLGRVKFQIFLPSGTEQSNEGLFGYRYLMTAVFVAWPAVREHYLGALT